MTSPTKPNSQTKAAEQAEATMKPGADRPPTPEEERSADKNPLQEGVAAHEEEMAERGAHQKGEGRVG